MNTEYKKEYSLRFSDFDRFDNFAAWGILDLFQDSASRHGESLGIGYEKMLGNNLLWVISKVKFKILSPLKVYEDVTVSTNPLKSSRAVFLRDYKIYDEKGKLAVIGSSQWTLIDVSSRRLVPLGGVMPELDYSGIVPNFPEKFKKISYFFCGEKKISLTPPFSSLDHNGHINNVGYTRFVYDALKLKENENIEFFQMDYLSEILLGDTVEMYVKRDGKNIYCKGVGNGEVTKFVCEIVLR